MTEDGFYNTDPGHTFFGDERYPNFSIKEYFEELKIEFKQHDSDSHIEYALCCPKCVERGEDRPDEKYRLWVNEKNAMFYCYNCDWSGMLITLIRVLSNVNLEKAIKILKGKSLDPLEHLNLKLYEKKVEPDEPDQILKEIHFPHGYEPITYNHPYLKLRGIPLKYAEEFEWGSSNVGYTKDRIIVPTYMNSLLVFWQARATWDDPKKDFKKVLNPKGVSAKPVLYQFDSAKEYKTIIIAEGFMDAAKIGPDAVATNGKRIHSAQVELLQMTKAETIILMYDRDAFKPGRKKDGITQPSSAMRAIEILKTAFKVKVALLSDERDPGDYSYLSTELRNFAKNAKNPS